MDRAPSTGTAPARDVMWNQTVALAGPASMDGACELLVARAQGSSVGVLLVGSASAFEELLEYVLSEANAETNRARGRRLDEACDSLEAALAG